MAVKRYALCLSNDFGPDFDAGHVLPGLVYEALGEERGMLRVIDDSGEDYLYPGQSFRLLSEADSMVLAHSLGKLVA